jgi:lipopolysaccharide export system permease protein
MRAISRYIFRQLFDATVFVTIALACAIWLTQSLRFVELIINRGLSLGAFAYLTMLLLPTFLTVILPIATLSAILFVYNKLTIDSELVVLRAAGMSQGSLAKPALLLAVLVSVICLSLNVYFLPTSYRQFKDLEFTIRNDYSAILLQEGVFNTLTEGLTVYVRARESNGELLGVLMHDNRQPTKPVTMMAERGAMVASDSGPRVVMFKGNRQEIERESGELSLLYFDRYIFDLGQFTDEIEERWREPRERYLHELFFPDYESAADSYYADKLIAEGHQRLANSFLVVAFVFVGLAALLSGQFNRRGQLRRILVAAGLVVAIQSAGLGLHNLTSRQPAAAPLIYLNVLLPILISTIVLTHRPRRRLVGLTPRATMDAG